MMTLKEMINRSGYSIVELSKFSGITRQTIYRVLSGKKTSNKTLVKLTKVLGYTIDDLR